MDSQLQSLLDLRRDAEDRAKRALAAASAALVKEQEEHERLLGRWQRARATLDRESNRLAAGTGPSTVAQGHAWAGYLARLRDEVAHQKSAAEAHRATALANAQAAHHQALAVYAKAARDREAISKAKQRANAEKTKRAARRAEDAASDLAARRRR
jgi:hypothetical protein